MLFSLLFKIAEIVLVERPKYVSQSNPISEEQMVTNSLTVI